MTVGDWYLVVVMMIIMIYLSVPHIGKLMYSAKIWVNKTYKNNMMVTKNINVQAMVMQWSH